MWCKHCSELDVNHSYQTARSGGGTFVTRCTTCVMNPIGFRPQQPAANFVQLKPEHGYSMAMSKEEGGKVAVLENDPCVDLLVAFHLPFPLERQRTGELSI